MGISKNTIQAAKLKAQCLALLDEVARSGQTFTITKRGKPVARLVPVEAPKSLKGSVTELADTLAPYRYQLGSKPMVVLDTHVFLWWVNESKQLPVEARKAIRSAKKLALLQFHFGRSAC